MKVAQDKHKQFDKQVLAKIRRINAIWDEFRNLPAHKLKEPIQSGWRRLFRVREDIMRSSMGRDYLLILPHVQKEIYAPRTDFVIRGGYWDKDHGYSASKKTDLKLNHGIKRIAQEKWEETGLPDRFQEKYFRLETLEAITWGTFTKIRKGWAIRRKHVFEPYVLPHFLTHYTEKVGHLETELHEINRWMEVNHGWDHNINKHGHGHRRSSDYPDDRMSIREELIARGIRVGDDYT